MPGLLIAPIDPFFQELNRLQTMLDEVKPDISLANDYVRFGHFDESHDLLNASMVKLSIIMDQFLILLRSQNADLS